MAAASVPCSAILTGVTAGLTWVAASETAAGPAGAREVPDCPAGEAGCPPGAGLPDITTATAMTAAAPMASTATARTPRPGSLPGLTTPASPPCTDAPIMRAATTRRYDLGKHSYRRDCAAPRIMADHVTCAKALAQARGCGYWTSTHHPIPGVRYCGAGLWLGIT